MGFTITVELLKKINNILLNESLSQILSQLLDYGSTEDTLSLTGKNIMSAWQFMAYKALASTPLCVTLLQPAGLRGVAF